MTKEEMREEIKKGYRDKRGARRQKPMKHQYKGGENIEDITGNELLATIELARQNMRRNIGRARFFTAEELRQEIIKYWNYIEEQNLKGNALIPDVEGLATFLGVTRDTLRLWERGEVMAREGFSEIIAQAKNDIAACKKQLGQHGNLPPIVMAMDFNNNHNYTQRQEVVVQPRNPLGEQKPTSALLEKYMNLIEDEPKLPEPVIEVDPIEEEENDID